jgi:hypothetical protein
LIPQLPVRGFGHSQRAAYTPLHLVVSSCRPRCYFGLRINAATAGKARWISGSLASDPEGLADSPATRTDTHNRVRRDRVDNTGALSLRLAGRLHHIGVGRTHAGTRILMLICDLNVRVIDAATGELIRELTIDPTRD